MTPQEHLFGEDPPECKLDKSSNLIPDNKFPRVFPMHVTVKTKGFTENRYVAVHATAHVVEPDRDWRAYMASPVAHFFLGRAALVLKMP